MDVSQMISKNTNSKKKYNRQKIIIIQYCIQKKSIKNTNIYIYANIYIYNIFI